MTCLGGIWAYPLRGVHVYPPVRAINYTGMSSYCCLTLSINTTTELGMTNESFHVLFPTWITTSFHTIINIQ
jgi:hypothetical protein